MLERDVECIAQMRHKCICSGGWTAHIRLHGISEEINVIINSAVFFFFALPILVRLFAFLAGNACVMHCIILHAHIRIWAPYSLASCVDSPMQHSIWRFVTLQWSACCRFDYLLANTHMEKIEREKKKIFTKNLQSQVFMRPNSPQSAAVLSIVLFFTFSAAFSCAVANTSSLWIFKITHTNTVDK